MPQLQSVHASELALESMGAWHVQFEDLKRRIACRFSRYDAHAHACEYIKALLSPIERKNAWQIAEQAQVESPYCFQHLINRGKWEAELVRDDLFDYVNDNLADEGGVLALDETGFLKKGDKSAGVARQYSGTAGRIENAQIGVFVSYASAKGQTLIDRELYLPQSWLDDPIRCIAAGVPEKTEFATKPQLAHRMLKRIVAAKVPFSWVCGDSVYGSDPYLRRYLESERLPYVLQVRSNQTVFKNSHYWRVDALAAKLDPADWQVHSAGEGSQGERFYEWALIECAYGGDTFFGRWLLLRRSLTEPSELAYYQVFAYHGTPIETLARVTGKRWTIETCFQVGKNEVGLDQYQVRTWAGWYRHVTLAMLAQAFLSVARSQSLELQKGGSKPVSQESMSAFKRSRGL